MRTCPVCNGEGYVRMPYPDEYASSPNGMDDHTLPCGECDGTGKVLGAKDEFTGYFFAELGHWHEWISRIVMITWFVSLAAFFLQITPLVLALPVSATICFVYLLAIRHRTRFRSYGMAAVLLALAWLIYGALFLFRSGNQIMFKLLIVLDSLLGPT